MESNAMPGGMYSGVNPGMLGLEMSLHHNYQPQNPQSPHHRQPQQQNPIVGNGQSEGDYQRLAQKPVKKGYPCGVNAKNHSLTLSDDDEPTENNSADDGKRKMSPWQRMKWTDNMVRLLIMVVYYIGDEGNSDGNDPTGKKKGVGVLQKKGKWKSVSRAMMERGFYVSPQQCEDKFNDLNKRYKRVNDIIGKGTACRVVENQGLLDTMDHIPPKLKEEVRKLLNSKHLFFREMCAYHNSCGHGSGASGSGNAGAQHSPVEAPAAETAHAQQQQRRCLHSSENTSVMPNLNRSEAERCKLAKALSGEDDEDDDSDDEDDEDENEDDEDVTEGGSRGHEEDSTDERSSRKRQRKNNVFSSPLIQRLSTDLMNVLQDGAKSPSEKRHWIKAQLRQLEEQHVGIQCQAFELEKQQLKWLKFRSKKERDMEREKLTNERLRLENERMTLLVHQKELELLELHQLPQQHSSNWRGGDPSTITG